MSPWIQACIVVMAIAQLVIAAVLVVAVAKLTQLSKQLSDATDKTVQAVQQSVSHVQGVTQRIDGVVASLGQAVPAIHRVVHQFERVGERASDLSNAVLEEIEAPVRNAVAVARGVRTGTSFLLQALARRAHLSSSTNGGQRP